MVEPHATRGMHVVARITTFPEAVLVQGDVGRGEEDRKKAERPRMYQFEMYSGDVARGDGHVRVHAVEDEAQQRISPPPARPTRDTPVGPASRPALK